MRILFIRHGDPDYINDTLTKKGHREAKLLAERAADEFFQLQQRDQFGVPPFPFPPGKTVKTGAGGQIIFYR